MYNIVIVEDEHIESEALRRIISNCVDNSIIYEASTGKKAIQLIDQLNKIDMIFVDINIPLPNGSQVIEYLRTKNTKTKIIVTTANDDFDLARNMITLKVDEYLLKPVKQSILLDTIKKTLEYNEDDNTQSREMKKKIFSLIDRCDYPQWHDYMFNILDDASQERQIGQHKKITDFLEIFNQAIASKGDKCAHLHIKNGLLIQDIKMHGLSAHSYYRMMLAMLSISVGVFEHTAKNCSVTMDFVDRAKFHIEENILKNLTLDDIAAKSFVSPCYLSRAFKKITGIGFSNYISNRKISIAKSLLQFSDLKVNTIALELSYQDANYFCRIFKKETGMAPSDYRKMGSLEHS
ncbi:AraC family transcriptional regulator [Acerihabitans sp. TG2]|uniref:response regulator transcription factor n=1 Tax=Acerihabitans sp. TG2 TaxID=3096008 RepID=UPI002B231732|nr:AraC family transcriptional regulator [Acerihabitans sp. TG2]MEA9390229.1 AraC family transcriptional regulator [Acerihabitans sp. TG2]